MDRLTWILDLQDRLSGPAARMERQLGQVRAQLRALDIQSKQNNLDKITDPLKRQRAELQLQRDRLMLSKAALDKTGQSARSAGHDAGFFTRQLHDILHIAQIVGGALERMGMSARNVAKAISFREGEMIGLQTFLGGKAGGVFDRLTDFAAKTGRSAEEMIGFAKSLSMAGVAAQDLEPIIKRLAGLNNISAGSGNTVGQVISNIFAVGKGGAGDIEALRGTPIKPEKIYEDIAQKFTGVRNRIAGKLIAENDLGLGKNFLTSLILGEADKVGAGKAAFAGGATLEARFEGVFTQMNRMFERLSKSAGVRGLKGVLKNLQDVFNPDSATGQKTLARLTALSNALAQALDPLTGTEGRQRMEAFFDSLTRILEGVLPLLEKAAKFTEVLVRYTAGDRNPEAPKTVGEEYGQLRNYFDPKNNRLTSWMFGRTNSQFPSPYKQFATPVININVDARGASKEDAEHIANKAAQRAKDALTDAIEHSNGGN